jgi:hypothetical protein
MKINQEIDVPVSLEDRQTLFATPLTAAADGRYVKGLG